jgi:hypothetical protein
MAATNSHIWYQVISILSSHLDDSYLTALASLTTSNTRNLVNYDIQSKEIYEIAHHVAKNEEYSFFRDIAYQDLAYRRIVRVYAAESDSNTILFWDDSWDSTREFETYGEFQEFLRSISSQIVLDK